MNHNQAVASETNTVKYRYEVFERDGEFFWGFKGRGEALSEGWPTAERAERDLCLMLANRALAIEAARTRNEIRRIIGAGNDMVDSLLARLPV